jgi:hypothetical protein
LINAAPGTLDTLDELANALGDDPNFAVTMTNNLALKAPLANPALTGTPTAPTAAVDVNTTQIATTAYVVGQGYLKIATAAATYAPLNSPVLTGTPTAPTAATADDSLQIATTAYVNKTIDSYMSKSITGSVTLTTAESMYRMIAFTGALTGNAVVTLPQSSTRLLVENKTTGPYTMTFKMTSGTGVVVAQGTRAELYSDAVNVMTAVTDFTDINIPGTPTTTTAAAADNTTRIASTAHVKAAIAASNTVKNDSTLSTDPFGLVTTNETLTLNSGWTDTSIVGTSLASGSYLVQLYSDGQAADGNYQTYYTGNISWFSGATNSIEADEVLLHSAGRDSSANGIYMRVLRTAGGSMKLQLSADSTSSGPVTYVIKFRRLI